MQRRIRWRLMLSTPHRVKRTCSHASPQPADGDDAPTDPRGKTQFALRLHAVSMAAFNAVCVTNCIRYGNSLLYNLAAVPHSLLPRGFACSDSESLSLATGLIGWGNSCQAKAGEGHECAAHAVRLRKVSLYNRLVIRLEAFTVGWHSGQQSDLRRERVAMLASPPPLQQAPLLLLLQCLPLTH